MSKKITEIKENFSKEDFDTISLISSMMSYLSYEIPKYYYYVLGNGTMLTFPFERNKDNRFKYIFNYIREICYSSGSWYIPYITNDAKSFYTKIKEKSLEWTKAFQPMPIFAAMQSIDSNVINQYILVSADLTNDTLDFLNASGEIEKISIKKIINRKSNYFGFATINVPNNFLARQKDFMDITHAMNMSLYKTKYYVNKSAYFNDAICALDEASIKQNDFKINEILGLIADNADINPAESGLFRENYGDALKAFGTKTNNESIKNAGGEYVQISMMWKEVFDKYNKSLVNDYYMLSKLCSKELYLIKELNISALCYANL